MKKQVIVTIVVNLLSILYGISIGWVAPNMLLFQSESSPIGVVTSDQTSLIVSLLCIGGVAGTIVFGFGADYLGRKVMLLIMAIPGMVANVLLIIGTNPGYIYAARLLFGFSGSGAFIVVPMFVSEISHERIRGALLSVLGIFLNLGIVIGYMLASWMNYYQMPYVSITLLIIFMGIFAWFPDSPDYLAHVNKLEAAAKAYEFYGNNRVTALDTETPTQSKLEKPKITLEDFKDIAVLKGIAISFAMIIFADTSGIFIMQSYLTEVFDWAHIKLDANVATIVVGAIQVVGAIISSILIDRFGRRFLLIFSCTGTGLCFYALSYYFYILPHPEHADLIEKLHWLPVVTIGGAVLLASIGVVTLAFFLIAELTPTKLRGAITSVALALSWAFASLVVQYYHTLVEVLGIAGTIFAFATSCTIELFFVYFFLPETKNLTFEEIQQRLRSS